MTLGGKNRFRKVLLGVQLFLTFLTLFAAISFVTEAKDIEEKPWGYDPENLVNIKLAHENLFSQYFSILWGESAKNHFGFSIGHY